MAVPYPATHRLGAAASEDNCHFFPNCLGFIWAPFRASTHSNAPAARPLRPAKTNTRGRVLIGVSWLPEMTVLTRTAPEYGGWPYLTADVPCRVGTVPSGLLVLGGREKPYLRFLRRPS